MHNILLYRLLPHNAILESFYYKNDLLSILLSYIPATEYLESWINLSARAFGLSWEDQSIFDIFGNFHLFRKRNIAVVYIGYLYLNFVRFTIYENLLLRRWITFNLNYFEVAKANIEIYNSFTHWHVLLFCLGIMQIIIFLTLCPQNLRTLSTYQCENVILTIAFGAILLKPILCHHLINLCRFHNFILRNFILPIVLVLLFLRS